MVPKSYAGMYSGLLVSPWACSLEDEQKVLNSFVFVQSLLEMHRISGRPNNPALLISGIRPDT
jgi:hypothetical protein